MLLDFFDIIYSALLTLASFMLIVSIMVFIHEWGHFYAARLCGVRVETFAIGFGKKIWGVIDKKGTEWRVNILPMGGYVRMFGDAGASSAPDIERLAEMSDNDKSISFHHKKLWQRAFIIFAGPFMNYVLAFVVMVFLVFKYGNTIITTEVISVEKGSPAEMAGIVPGDTVISVNKQISDNMMDVRDAISAAKENGEIMVVLKHGDKERSLTLKPVDTTLPDGTVVRRIGIIGGVIKTTPVSMFDVLPIAAERIYSMNNNMMKGVYGLFTGQVNVNKIGGPVKIAQLSKMSAEHGLQSFLSLLTFLSLNLGLFNLLPLPGLDGGHLMYYIVHAIRGKPISYEMQSLGIKIGVIFLILFAVFVTWNDIVSILRR